MNSIFDIVDKNEKTIVVLTKDDSMGSGFMFNNDNTGYTGDWHIRKNSGVEYIVIYHRNDESINIIYKATITSVELLDNINYMKPRYIIKFKEIKKLGITDKNWCDFMNSGSNPIRYIN